MYDFENQKSWRVSHNYFGYDPVQGDFNIDNINFQWQDGVFGMALDKIRNEHG